MNQTTAPHASRATITALAIAAAAYINEATDDYVYDESTLASVLDQACN